MDTLVLVLLLLLGLGLLIGGAEALVAGASSLARRFGISEIAIGLTVVAFGTSTPELAVNLVAGAEGRADVVFGNVLGSNLFNILLILGVAGLIRPLAAQVATTWREIPISLGALLLLALLVKDGLRGAPEMLSRFDGAILLVGFTLFLLYVWRSMRRDEVIQGESPETMAPWLAVVAALAGLGALFGGGRLLVDQAVELARLFGVGERVIALTIVAGGTSLPELATSAVAAWRNRPDIAIGNVVGSNIFNIFLILGLGGLLAPLGYPASFDADLLVLALATLLLFAFMFTGSRHRLDRWEAGLLLGLHVAYTGWLILR